MKIVYIKVPANWQGRPGNIGNVSDCKQQRTENELVFFSMFPKYSKILGQCSSGGLICFVRGLQTLKLWYLFFLWYTVYLRWILLQWWNDTGNSTTSRAVFHSCVDTQSSMSIIILPHSYLYHIWLSPLPRYFQFYINDSDASGERTGGQVLGQITRFSIDFTKRVVCRSCVIYV